MTRNRLFVLAAVCLLAATLPSPLFAQAPPGERTLTIVSAGPDGEIASLAEANEIRIVFSEPMVTLGRIPAVVRAPFVRITPAIAGTFRWSGTTILIFTPNPKQPLPFATEYEVTVDASATAVSGRKLAEPYSFSFTTPTVKLLRTIAYRRGGRASAPYVILLRFNQAVDPAAVLRNLKPTFQPHDWSAPKMTADAERRLAAIDKTAVGKFEAKAKAARAAATSNAPVTARLTNEWDKKQYPPSKDLVVIETVTAIPSGSWITLTLSGSLPGLSGSATPGTPQQYTVHAEPPFFIYGFECETQCDPDDYNPVNLGTRVEIDRFSKALRITDVTGNQSRDVAADSTAPSQARFRDDATYLTLEDGGFKPQPPATRYVVRLDANLESIDGQTLGYTWVGTIENWHRTAFASFGDGHGVWEAGGGNVLPFYARNLFRVNQWAAPLKTDDLMPTIRSLTPEFNLRPDVTPLDRKLAMTPDRIQSYGFDFSKALGSNGKGIVWAAVENGTSVENARRPSRSLRASVVQVTNLGITVKHSPHNTLVFVTRLDDAAPVAGAKVSIVNRDNSLTWSGTTNTDGVVIGPGVDIKEREYRGEDTEYAEWQRPDFLVLAEKEGDVAYVANNWDEGIESWQFGMPFNRDEAEPMLRGTVFSDRGVYRLGEEVHLKAILRQNTATGIRLLRKGTPILISLRDSQDRLVEEKTVELNDWSTAEWTMNVPADGVLGDYSVRAILESDKPKPRTPESLSPGDHPSPRLDNHVPWQRTVAGSFLVAAYRRPDFRVDVTLKGTGNVAGEPLKGVVSARYLFGAPMGVRPVKWTFSRTSTSAVPAAITDIYSTDQWQFIGWIENQDSRSKEISSAEATLTKTGDLTLSLTPQVDAGIPFVYSLEGDVEDVSRQHIANRTTLVVHPAPWYIGLRRPQYFVNQKTGVQTAIVAITPDGKVVPGVTVDVKLTQVQWHSVRRAEGNGFYAWESERKEVDAGSWTITSAAEPVPLEIKPAAGGMFILQATARESGTKRFVTTRTQFYVLGDGYTAWARFDHNRIELTPEKQTYKPGDTARIMIQSPWEKATALVTVEREGVRSHQQFALTSTQQSIPVAISEEEIPNVFVSVLLVKGRTTNAPTDDAIASAAGSDSRNPNVTEDLSDPGKPSFRLGYVELMVEDASKRLTVDVRADKEEYRPANAAKVQVNVKDRNGRGAPSEVTLWAVDYGVLSLTAYRTPDVLGSVYVHKALQVSNADNRQRIISRRVVTPKGETDGGGGGDEPGAGTMRKDFRVLAFWIGSLTTDEYGRGTADVKLPESLTTYRIMAVAGDRSSRFGAGDSDVRINKPLTMKPTFPRFLALGDKAYFGAVLTSQLKQAGAATVTIKSLDPDVLEFTTSTELTLPMAAGGSSEARFDAATKKVGRARIQMTAKLADETDAFEDVIPVEVLVSPETVAAYGEATDANPTATETLTIPASIVPGLGGLRVDLSSTAMVGLAEGARYLVEYPYGCAEQRGSRALALLLAADLGDAFTLPGMDTSKMRPAVQETLKTLEKYQCGDGGFAYWPGGCPWTSPYLTSYLLHVFKTASDHKFTVNPQMRENAYSYLERELAAEPPNNEGWWPAYTAWQAFAVKVLVEGGRNQDSNLTRLYGYRERMPVFGLAYLHDALMSRGGAKPSTDAAARIADLRRRMVNAILPEGGSAHVEELNDPYLMWFWNSNVRSTAIVLTSLVRSDVADAPVRQLVRWMMAARKDGRWGNTQENAMAMEALVAYYRKFEAAPPDFRAVVKLGAEDFATETFKGRSTTATSKELPMAKVLATGNAGTNKPLTFSREGTGTLFYTARLRYAADELYQEGQDSGIHIERSYSPYVESGNRPPSLIYKAGDLVRVTLTFNLTKERRYVAVTDPLPAGFEAVESWFATTAAALARTPSNLGDSGGSWYSWWERGGFDHVERLDDRVQLFATRLAEGKHEFTYIARATTAGSFRTAPARAEEMYEPEVFGRTQTHVIEVKR